MMKKNLQDRIDQLSAYFVSMERYNDAIIVKMSFPPRWTVGPSEDGRIKVTVGDENGYYYFYADSNDATYDDIFSLIEETVSVNETALKKLELLKAKVEELKMIFSDPEKSFDELESIEFKFGKKKRQRKPQAKAVEEIKLEEAEEEKTTVNED